VADPAVPPSLASDSTYLAFQRALGNEQDVATRNAQDQSDAIDRSTALRLPQIAQAGTYARQGINGSMEARGILRSGETLNALDRQRQSEADQTAGIYDDAAQRKAAIQQALASQIAGFGSRTAEANLTAGGNQQNASDTAALQKALADGMAGIGSGIDYSSLLGLGSDISPTPADVPAAPASVPPAVPALAGDPFSGSGASGSWAPQPKKRTGRAY
jgi:hypothetical protein